MPSKAQKKTSTKWMVESVKLVDVKPFRDNPREISERKKKGLYSSLAEFGYVDLIVWNKRTGNIVGGHQRYGILVEAGLKEADMIVVDFPEKEELAANLTMNNPEIEGEWDDPISELLVSVENTNPDFFVSGNLNDLRDAVNSMVPRNGEDSHGEENPKVDPGGLLSNCDTRCPCCDFEWDLEDGDVTVMTEAEQAGVK